MNVPHESAEVVRALVEAFGRVRTVIDVGCGDGYEISQVNADRRIGIDANRQVDQPFKNVEYYSAAIAEYNGLGYLFDGPGPGCNSLHAREGSCVEVPVYRLDNFCVIHSINANTVDALIIDTEGTTFDVLVGAGDIVNKYVKYIYAEVQLERFYPSKLAYEIDRYLQSFSFSVTKAILPAYTCDDGRQANYLWTRK